MESLRQAPRPTLGPTTRERRLIWLFGPAFVAAIAYVDPGNVAANLSAGADFRYLLVWVVVAATAMAGLIQYMSAKLGLVTGRTLPEIVGDRLPRRARLLYWAQAEVTAAATDLAEVVGGAIGLNIIFGLPLVVGSMAVGTVSMTLLVLQSRRGQRPFEFVVMGLLAVITIGFVAGLLSSPISGAHAVAGIVPRFNGPPSVLLAASILGSTVMPHAIYVHSALALDRHGSSNDARRVGRLLRATRWDLAGALTVAGGVNVAMLLVAASTLPGVADADTLQGAAGAISTHLGAAIGVLFGVSLVASGFASTSMGCYAGAAIMDGLLRTRIPLLARRIVTIVPALVILGLGVDPTQLLVLSQAVLSMGIPFALIPLARYTSSQRIMGGFANGTTVRISGVVVATVIVVLNVALVFLTFTGRV